MLADCHRHRVAFLLSLAASVSFAPLALGYCRTTTCDPKTMECAPDANGCYTVGEKLFWARKCTAFGVQQAGSVTHGIGYSEARDIIGQAFQRWASADCGGGATPSIEIQGYLDPIVCATPEYNQDSGNANVWIFRDDYWPPEYATRTLAVTTVTFDIKTGEIYDADVELNAHEKDFTTSNTGVRWDLPSIVTHEAGHFLGLAHSAQPLATMSPEYEEGDVSLRTLDTDDTLGICEAYAPDRNAAVCNIEPRHGFSAECREPPEDKGCQFAIGTAPIRGEAWLSVLALAGLGLIRRRTGV